MATVEEWVSGNGRNRCAFVIVNGETVAQYHIKDCGRGYRAMAEADAARRNAVEGSAAR